MKICAQCKIEKDDYCFNATQLKKLLNGSNCGKCKACISEYGKKYHKEHREETNKRHRDYYKKNNDKITKRTKQYYEENIEYYKEYQKQWRQENKDEINEYQKIYIKNRRKNDPEYRLQKNISRSVRFILKDKKGGQSVLKYLPYTMEELKNHIEKQFESWMTWENWGKYNPKTHAEKPTWNLDHIIAHSKFKYDNMDCQEFKDCWALSNLQPLDARENIFKGNR